MNYDEAIAALNSGKKIKRHGWPVCLKKVDDLIIVDNGVDGLTEWEPLHNDKIATDWLEVAQKTYTKEVI